MIVNYKQFAVADPSNRHPVVKASHEDYAVGVDATRLHDLRIHGITMDVEAEG